MSGAAGPAACAERAGVVAEARPLFRSVSFEVAPGAALALLGDSAAARGIVRALAGRLPLSEGRMKVLGEEPSRRWRLRSRRSYSASGDSLPIDRIRGPDLLLLEEGAVVSAAGRAWILDRLGAGMAAVIATADAELATGLAHRAALLARGRLIAEGRIPELVGRFRRLRFVSRLTETRSAFGTELDEFESVRVRVRGWGIEAVVSNFDESALERLRGVDGVSEVAAEPMTLAEIAETCGEGA